MNRQPRPAHANTAASRNLPAATRRLFLHDSIDELTTDSIIERLLEEGDRGDLSWLAETVGEPRLTEVFQRLGHRRLSRRSERFWRLVLHDSIASPEVVDSLEARRDELWPL